MLPARKKKLITARARKIKRSARTLANARKDHSIPLGVLDLPLMAGVNMNLSEVLRGLNMKGWKKENYICTTRQLISTREHSRLSGDYFGVHLLIFKFKF